MSGRVVVVGSLNLDLVTHVERHPKPGETLLGDTLTRVAGGKGANQAVGARTAGAEVLMVGHIGDDEGGSAYRERLSARGLDTSLLVTDPERPTGHALIVVDASGENSIVVIPGANASERWTDTLARALDTLTADDVMLLQEEIPLEIVADAARGAHAKGARVVINMAPFASLPADVVALADPIVVNEHEALQLADADLVPRSTVTTFGAAGAAWDAEKRPGVEVPRAEVLDTTGAGDAFCGALCAALASGADRSRALDVALQAGADAVRHHGAQPDGAL